MRCSNCFFIIVLLLPLFLCIFLCSCPGLHLPTYPPTHLPTASAYAYWHARTRTEICVLKYTHTLNLFPVRTHTHRFVLFKCHLEMSPKCTIFVPSFSYRYGKQKSNVSKQGCVLEYTNRRANQKDC